MRRASTLALLLTLALTSCDPPRNSNANRSGNSNGNSNSQVLVTPQPLVPPQPADPNFKSCNPYFPLVPGSKMKYVINYSSGLVGDAEVVVGSSEENGRTVFTETSQIVDRQKGLHIIQKSTRKYVCDGERVIILSDVTDSKIEDSRSIANQKYRENSVVMADTATLAIKNSTWSYSFTQTIEVPGSPPASLDDPVVISYTVLGEEEVQLPTGKFKALKLLRKVRENLIEEHYVAGLGLVKRKSNEGTNWELREYSGLRPTNQ